MSVWGVDGATERRRALWPAAAERLPAGDGRLSLAIAIATGLTTAAVGLARAGGGPWCLLYVLPGFFAFLCLRVRVALAHAALIAACYGGALLLGHRGGAGDGGATRWAMLVATVLIVGRLAHGLRASGERLIERLSEAAVTDVLTGLLNRRGFDARIARELALAQATGTPMSVVIGDLDGLKTLNDRHGHQHGDEVLCEIARVATAAARRIDAVARLGGDEFALVLPRCGARDAHAVAERLRGRTRTALAGLGEGGSISFGVASYPEHAATVDDLVRHADHALYRAKRAGRDCTVLYGADVAAAHAAERCPHDAQLPAVLALAETLDLRSAGRAAHSRVVADHAQAIAEQLGLEPERVERVRLAALLRDIGKVGLPDALLNALGAGDPVEAAELRRHPELGSRILAGAGLDDLATWILAHHERVDGLGYPAGLAGDEIPLESRILAVASAFAAQTTDRPGWPAASPEQAAERLRDEAGTRFDPEVVEAFLESRRRAAAEAAG